MYLLQVTETRSHEIDEDLLGELWASQGQKENYEGLSLQEILAMGGGQYARQAEAWLIEMFEIYEGSQFGEKLFPGRADDDRGIELKWEDD